MWNHHCVTLICDEHIHEHESIMRFNQCSINKVQERFYFFFFVLFHYTKAFTTNSIYETLEKKEPGQYCSYKSSLFDIDLCLFCIPLNPFFMSFRKQTHNFMSICVYWTRDIVLTLCYWMQSNFIRLFKFQIHVLCLSSFTNL